MTAEEIRNNHIENSYDFDQTIMMREIAAQLAELNKTLSLLTNAILDQGNK